MLQESRRRSSESLLDANENTGIYDTKLLTPASVMLIILFFLSCQSQQDFDFQVSTPDQSSPQDTGDTEETPLEEVENLGDLFRLLNRQGYLDQNHQDMAARFIAEKQQSPVYCDEVWRVLLSDQGARIEEPEMIWEHASVPDVLILDSGAHLLVYNDLRKDIFMDILQNDPQRFWRQGFLGYGGVGFSIDNFDGQGFVELTNVDLQFEELQSAVDPDLGRMLDGTIRLSWFGMTTDVLENGFVSPMQTQKPHRFYRSEWQEDWTFSPPLMAVASYEGSTGGVDPTILTLNDGGEIMFVAPLDHYALGWYSPDGLSWPENADVETTVSGATADALLHNGMHHMYYMKNGFLGAFESTYSEDGFNWDIGPFTIFFEEGAHNITVDIDPENRIWVYYNQLNEACLDSLD